MTLVAKIWKKDSNSLKFYGLFSKCDNSSVYLCTVRDVPDVTNYTFTTYYYNPADYIQYIYKDKKL